LRRQGPRTNRNFSPSPDERDGATQGSYLICAAIRRIVLVAGPECQLAASGDRDIVTVAVSSKKE
jgi:hypothetical protein